MSHAPITVAILVIPESTGSIAYGFFDLFCSVRRDWGALVDDQSVESPFSVELVGRRKGSLTVANGLQVQAHQDLSQSYDIVCIPEVAVHPDADISGRYEEEIAWLTRCRSDGAVLATACTGALLLAEAGLLRGQDTTTHWLYCDRLARYPDVRVQPKRSLVISDGGHLVMAGGGTTFLDLALYLIARHVGLEEAMHTARMSLIDWHDVGQQPFSALCSGRRSEDAIIGECQLWIAENYAKESPVTAMLQVSGLAERSFHRRFRQSTGMTPIEYVHTVRLEEAKQMLETTDDSVEAIAMEVGYEDASFFRRLFRKKVGLTPTQYRKRFSGLRRALAQSSTTPVS